MLARAVDVGEGLLLEEARKVVASSHFLAQLHDDQVLVDLLGHAPEIGRHLVLVGGNLPVAGLERDAQREGLLLDGFDTVVGVGVERCEVVVAHLLPARLPTHKTPHTPRRKFSNTIHTTLRGVAPLPFCRRRFVCWAAVPVCDKQRLSHYVNTKYIRILQVVPEDQLLGHRGVAGIMGLDTLKHTLQHTLQQILQHLGVARLDVTRLVS